MVPFVAWPWLALLPAAWFGWWWFQRGRRRLGGAVVLATAILWTLYAAWEFSFKLRPVREWIRVDLLLILPILLFASAVSGIVIWRSRRS